MIILGVSQNAKQIYQCYVNFNILRSFCEYHQYAEQIHYVLNS